MKQLMGKIGLGFLTFWADRHEREKRMLSAAALFIFLLGIYFTLISPAWVGRKKLSQELPAQKQQVAQMRALAKQAQSLSDLPKSPQVTWSQKDFEDSLTQDIFEK